MWSPDGRSIAYVSVRDNTHGLYRRAADGTGNEERLYQHTTGAPIVLTDWSADGRFLCFWSGDTMFVLPLTGDRKPIELTGQEFVGRGGRFSPDSRLLAFNSNQSGRFQIYVRPFETSSIAREAAPPPPGRRGPSQVSSEGGIGGIVWRKDGKELFYLSQPPRQTVMAVDVTTTSGVRGASAAAAVRDADSGRRSRAAQHRQQSRRPAVRVRGQRAVASRALRRQGPAKAGRHRWF